MLHLRVVRPVQVPFSSSLSSTIESNSIIHSINHILFLCFCVFVCLCSHFESTSVDILNLYARVTGEPLNMDISSEIPKD